MPILLGGSIVDVFFFYGLSNMVGGPATSIAVLPSNLVAIDPAIFNWSGTPFGATASWLQLHNGVNNNAASAEIDPGGAGEHWGPEAEFTRQHRLYFPNREIYIVKLCEGATGFYPPISSDNWNVSSSNNLYSKSV